MTIKVVTPAGFVSKMEESDMLYNKDPDRKIATITINRPDKLNAFTYVMYHRLKELIEEINEDDEVKVVILKGAGRCFSSGHDVSELGFIHGHGTGKSNERRPAQRFKLLTDAFVMGRTGAYNAVLNCRKATIAQVHGYCYGGGLNICNACDIVIAAPNSLFTHPGYRYIGPTTDVWLLVQLVGLRAAKQITLTGNPVDARTALRIGLISEVVPTDKLEETVMETALSISKLPLDGIVMGKIQFEAVLDAMGQSSGHTANYIIHALQTGIRYEPGEFNLFRERKKSGTTSAIRSRKSFYGEKLPKPK